MEVTIIYPNTEAWQGYRPRKFLLAYLTSLPGRESHGNSVLSTINKSPSCSRPTWLLTRALDHLSSTTTKDIAMRFNQRKPPIRAVCVALDLTPAFVTVCLNNLLLKINRPHLHPATTRWLSCYLRGSPAKYLLRGQLRRLKTFTFAIKIVHC